MFVYVLVAEQDMSKKTTVLMILDGYGLNETTDHRYRFTITY